jgi:hypothetical protein
MKKIVTRIKGGLGNQLFCYAAARRLALANSAELVIDDVSGFVRDHQYRRRYALNHFHIPCRRATPQERLEPFERYRRGLMKWLSRKRPFAERRYVEQEGLDFDRRLLTLRVDGTLYLDGLWQGEGYFKDVEHAIRDDLRIIAPVDARNQSIAREIRNCNAVAVHVRWFDLPDGAGTHNVLGDYYQRAVALMECKSASPHYFLFSDNPTAARRRLEIPDSRITVVANNPSDESGYADLWLMTQCRHFITANSTFSWWGAWLRSPETDKIVICPRLVIPAGKKTAWNFEGQLPSSWLKV